MAVRTSEGIFLEILETEDAIGLPIEVDVFDGDDIATMLATLEGARNVGWSDPFGDIGSGRFLLSVADPKATGTIIRSGNLVKFKLGGVYRYSAWIENPKVVVASIAGVAGKHWSLGGRGREAYLERGIVYPAGYPASTSSDRVFTTATFGAVLKTLIDEAQARGALPDLTYNFDAVNDSQGNPWPNAVTLTIRARTSILDVWRQMVALGMESRMTNELRLEAFVDLSRHKEDDVIFREGPHLRAEVVKELQDAGLRSRVLVEGAGGKFVEVADPALEAIPRIGRREGGVEFSSSADPTTLQIVGEASLEVLSVQSEAIAVPVAHGPPEEGHFEPYADYRNGDWIRIDVPGFYDRAVHRVRQITVGQTEGPDYTVDLDLNSIAVEELVTLHRMIDALAGGSSGAGTGGGVSVITGPGNNNGPADVGKVGVDLGDAVAYLYDKIATVGLVKSLAGAPGSRLLVLSPGNLDSLTDVNLAGAVDGDFLKRVGGIWVPAVPAGGGGASADGIDADALHATYGDAFDGAGLDAKWTRQTVTAGEETFGRGFLELALSAATVGRGYYQTPAAMFTNGELILGPVAVQEVTLGGHMFGPYFVDNAGNGVGFSVYHDGNAYCWAIAGWVYSGTGTSLGSYGGLNFRRGERHWMRLRKAGTSYFGSVAYGGVNWSPETAAQVFATAVTRIGFGRIFNNIAGYKAAVGRFNVRNVS